MISQKFIGTSYKIPRKDGCYITGKNLEDCLDQLHKYSQKHKKSYIYYSTELMDDQRYKSYTSYVIEVRKSKEPCDFLVFTKLFRTPVVPRKNK